MTPPILGFFKKMPTPLLIRPPHPTIRNLRVEGFKTTPKIEQFAKIVIYLYGKFLYANSCNIDVLQGLNPLTHSFIMLQNGQTGFKIIAHVVTRQGF